MIPVAGAAGAQAIGHEYYFISLTPTLAVLFLFAFQECGDLWLRGLMLLGISIRLLDLSYLDLRPLFKPQANPEWTAAEQCEDLIKRTPQFPWKKGIAFRSSVEEYPFLGVCFGERQASKHSAFGFFWKRDPIPQDCRAEAETENLRLVACAGH